MRNYFKDTGIPKAMEWARAAPGTFVTALIAAPGAGKKVVICDIIIYDPAGTGKAVFRRGTYASSTQIFTLTGGSHSFTAPIALPDNEGLVVNNGTAGTALETVVTYYIQG